MKEMAVLVVVVIVAVVVVRWTVEMIVEIVA